MHFSCSPFWTAAINADCCNCCLGSGSSERPTYRVIIFHLQRYTCDADIISMRFQRNAFPVKGWIFECKLLQPIKKALKKQKTRTHFAAEEIAHVFQPSRYYYYFFQLASLFHYDFHCFFFFLNSTNLIVALSKVSGVGNNWQHCAAPLTLTLQTS